jgi:HD-GYP domain-containing protein (c-di-GMP phosphodiesterase class II)
MDTAKLSIGMYVGMLDRPWLETPFIFQGFEIKDRCEIEQLQQYCHQVYVEIERGKLSERTIRALAAGGPMTKVIGEHDALPGDKPGFLHQWIVRTGLKNFLARRRQKRAGEYEISSTVRKEAPHAARAYEQCAKSYRRIYERAGRAGFVEIERVIRAVTPLVQSILRNPNAMAWTVFSKKRSGQDYSRAVATSVLAIMFGRHLGFDKKRLQDLATGGLLLDIGNTELPDALVGAEGFITQDEYDQVPQHVQAGVDILQRSPGIEPAVFEMVMYHHERFDGSGYPYGLEGSNIPPFGRIAGIVDCYDAMTTRTSYSPALAAYDAARQLNEMRDEKFSMEVVEKFLHTIGMFPTGSVVELSDGAAGLVLEQNPDNLLQPKVLILITPKGGRLKKPKIMNPQDWKGRGLWIARGHEHGAFGIDPMAFFN